METLRSTSHLGSQEQLYKRQQRNMITQSYSDWLIRWYIKLRFHIINLDFLDAIDQHLTKHARILDIGCGFGLFSLYYAMQSSHRQITGFDLNAARIQQAQEVAQKLNLHNARFFCQDATIFEFTESYDAVVTLDLLHHVSPTVTERLISSAYDSLRPNGVLLVKDVTTRPWHKIAFTYVLDKLMMPRVPVHYRSTYEWRQVLYEAGFGTVYAYPLNDYLPYPHMLLVAHKE